MTTKRELHKILKAAAEEKKFNRFKSTELYDKQKEFCNATADHSEVALSAGNQTGKSLSNSYLVTTFLTGDYPDWWQGRRFPGPTRGWVVSESTLLTRDVFQRLLCGPPGDPSQLGSGMIPRDRIISTTLSHGVSGAFDTIRVKHVSGGVSELAFKSFEQGREKLQGSSLDFAAIDEEPELNLYLEIVARTIATGGCVVSSFTPLSGLNKVLPRFQERTPEAMRDRIIIRMRMQDCGHLQDPARQAALIATFPGSQRRARIDGLPMLGSGAVFDFPLEDLIEPITIGQVGNSGAFDVIHQTAGPIYDTRGWPWIWGLDFGIAHPFAAVLLGHDRTNDIVYVLAEIRMKDAIPPQHAMRMKMVGANVKVAYPHDGGKREYGSGETLATLYKREGLLMCPSHATFKNGGYDFEAGILEMEMRMRSGRLKVAARCVDWQSEYAAYHRDDGVVVKVNDDLLSATRIGLMALRDARPAALGGQRAMQTVNPNGNVALNAELSGEDLF